MSRERAKDLYFLLVIALLRVSRHLPLRVRDAIASAIGIAAYWISPRKRRLTWHALDGAFGDELTTARKRNIAKSTFYQFWRETLWNAPSAAELALVGRMSLRGEEHLRAALSRGKGVILLETNSLGSRALPRRVLHYHGYALLQVHTRTHVGSGFLVATRQWSWAARRLRRFFETCEKEFLAEIILLPRSDSLAFTRVLLDRLKKNSVICIAGDGRRSQRLIDVPFFGAERAFTTGIVSLARSSGATILPLFCIKNRDGRLEVIVESAIEVDAAAAREASVMEGVRQCATLLERYGRMYPEQFYGWRRLAQFRRSSDPDARGDAP